MLACRFDADDIAARLRGGEDCAGETAELPGAAAGACPASVLLPLFQDAAGWHLLYIVRARHEADRHSGEVAFPGGRAEPGDADAVATALREAREEIGLDPGLVRWPFDLEPEPSEVGRIFSLPLDWLSDPANRRVRIWPSPEHPEAREVIFYDERDGQRLWGVSARITLDLLGRLG